MRILPPTSEGIREAATLIRQGDIVAYPTETVYGLAADPFSNAAVQRLFEVKSRDTANPVLLLVADADQLAAVVARVSPAAAACMRAFWPGPLSLLFPKSDRLSPVLTAGRDTVCVRQTPHAVARDLCLAVGTAITSSSANRSGEPPARSLQELDLPGIAAGLDGGALPARAPSTVFDPETRAVLRQGAIAEADLAAVMGRVS